MPPGAVPLFLNPVAGRGRAGRHAAVIRDILAAGGITTELVESHAVGDLEKRIGEYARGNPGPIIVAGGDGSVHEAVNGILSSGSRVPLGLVPIGTGNDFAKACMIPLDWKTATLQLANRMADGAPARPVDAGRMNDRYFANGAGIGFDAKVNRIARRYRWPIGDLVYLLAVLEGLWDGVITPAVTMRFGDETFNGRVTLANVSNGAWVGGMFYIAPMAENDDGRFDLVYATAVTRRRVLALLPKLIRGTHINAAEVHCREVLDFELVADAPVPSHLDGETQPLQTEFRISMLKSALRVL